MQRLLSAGTLYIIVFLFLYSYSCIVARQKRKKKEIKRGKAAFKMFPQKQDLGAHCTHTNTSKCTKLAYTDALDTYTTL